MGAKIIHQKWRGCQGQLEAEPGLVETGQAGGRTMVGGDRAGSLAEALWSEQVPPTQPA